MGTARQGFDTLQQGGQAGAETTFNKLANQFDGILFPSVIDILSTPAASPTNGQRWLVGASPTGAWAGKANYIALYVNGWLFFAPTEGALIHVEDDDNPLLYDGAAWTVYTLTSIASGITASTTQTQGQMPLVAVVNVVATVANANDTVTLPPAVKGRKCIIMNKGANTLRVYPDVGDAIDSAALDAPTTIAAAASREFWGVSTTVWWTR